MLDKNETLIEDFKNQITRISPHKTDMYQAVTALKQKQVYMQ